MLLPPDSRANLTKRVRALEEAWYPEKVDLSVYLDQLKSFTFPAQAKFIYDPSPLKLAQCTRRPGKSYGAGIWLVDGALRWAGSQHLWLALTREEGRRVAWEPILMAIVERLGMPIGEGANQVQFLEGSLTVRFPNRSLIYIVGADANDKEKRKVKGQKFRRVVVDEAQDFVNGLQDLIHDVVAPAVAEYKGQIALLGTPGEVAAGFFYGLCTGEHPEAPGWSRHFWGWRENPHVSKEIADYIEDQSKKIPGYKTTSTYLRNYEGKWIADAKRLVYKFDVKRNVVKSLPNLPSGGWHRVLGIDLGFNDDSSFVSLSYHDNSPVCFVTGAEGGPGLDVTGVAEKVLELDDEAFYEVFMVDGANKQAVKELQNRHKIPLTCADKAGKADFIDIVNAAFERGELMLLEGKTEALQAELLTLTWDKRKLEKLKREETQSQANHYCDGMLYAYRHTYAHLSTAPEQPKTPDEEYENAIEARREAERAEAALFGPVW